MTARDPASSDWHGDLSDGALAPAERPLGATPSGPRYRLGGELGVGAMGRVRAAYDTLLEREVALKQVRAEGDAAAEAALLREARVTAGLDHPAIIAVLDAGAEVDGRPFYAMRVVHGRNLADVVAGAPDPSARMALVRAVLQVAQAMAYAHARGVVHRDLSPRNVRVGAHGEVVVMDWGLAATTDEAARQRVVCGTPGYRAPELARGDPASPASDVWSLGALLGLVVTGQPLAAELPRRGLRSELRALLARALAPQAAARYPDAGAFAADLAAFLDGGRVGAHRDRPWHRAARLARRHPGAIAAGTVGLATAAVVAVVLGSAAIRRAAEARRSRSEARVALRQMIVERIGDAVLADRRAEVEALAGRAYELGATAAAAGARAAFAWSSPVVVRTVGDEQGCVTLDVRGGGDRLCRAHDALWLDRGGARRQLDLDGRAPIAARFLADGGVIATTTSDGGNYVVRFDGGLRARGRHLTGGGALSLDEAAGWAIVGATDLVLAIGADGAARTHRPCRPGAALRLIAAHPSSTPAEAATVVVCSDGTLVIGGPSGSTRVNANELAARLPGAVTGVVVDGGLAVGGSDARVGLVALPGGEVQHVGSSPVGPVSRLGRGPGGQVIVAGADGVGLWRPDVGAWRHLVTANQAVDAGVVGEAAVAFGAGTLTSWAVTADAHTHRATARAGLAALAWSADGAQVAFGGGLGGVYVLDVQRGQLRQVAVTDEVVKSLAFAPAGRALAVGIATSDGLRVLELDDLGERPGAWREPGLPVRRLAFLAEDVVVAFTYGLVPFAFAIDGDGARAIATVSEPVRDTATAVEPGAVFALGVRAALWRYDASGQQRLRDAPGATVVAVSGDGRVLALGSDHGRIELRSTVDDGDRGGLDAPGAAIEDAALDRGGAHLALARLDGTVEVWRIADRRLVLSVRAHAGRAAAVSFSPDGCTLATAGWDAVARLLVVCDPGASR